MSDPLAGADEAANKGDAINDELGESLSPSGLSSSWSNANGLVDEGADELAPSSGEARSEPNAKANDSRVGLNTAEEAEPDKPKKDPSNKPPSNGCSLTSSLLGGVGGEYVGPSIENLDDDDSLESTREAGVSSPSAAERDSPKAAARAAWSS